MHSLSGLRERLGVRVPISSTDRSGERKDLGQAENICDQQDHEHRKQDTWDFASVAPGWKLIDARSQIPRLIVAERGDPGLQFGPVHSLGGQRAADLVARQPAVDLRSHGGIAADDLLGADQCGLGRHHKPGAEQANATEGHDGLFDSRHCDLQWQGRSQKANGIVYLSESCARMN